MTFRLRRARPRDAAELTQLVYLSKQSNGYDDAFMLACAEELRITPQDIEDSLIWVAEADHLLGCVTMVPSGTKGEISSFFIHPNSKRKGIGKALWQLVLQEAQTAKITHLTLHADPAAVPFYEVMGFVITGQTPSGSIPGRFLPVMERAVAHP